MVSKWGVKRKRAMQKTESELGCLEKTSIEFEPAAGAAANRYPNKKPVEKRSC